jgi:hypothetical protein
LSGFLDESAAFMRRFWRALQEWRSSDKTDVCRAVIQGGWVQEMPDKGETDVPAG